MVHTVLGGGEYPISLNLGKATYLVSAPQICGRETRRKINIGIHFRST
jgi:hypothetical protein